MKSETKKAVDEAVSSSKPSETEKRIVQAFEKLEAIKKWKTEELKKTKEKIEGAQARLRESIELGTKVGNDAESIAKLRVVEKSWQELDEAKAARVEVRKAAKENIAIAEKLLRDCVELSSQMLLFTDPSLDKKE